MGVDVGVGVGVGVVGRGGGGGGERGWGRGGSWPSMTEYPRIPTIAERSTSGFH